MILQQFILVICAWVYLSPVQVQCACSSEMQGCFTCDSFKNVRELGAADWSYLVIKHYGSEPNKELPVRGMFKRTPNIKYLDLIGVISNQQQFVQILQMMTNLKHLERLTLESNALTSVLPGTKWPKVELLTLRSNNFEIVNILNDIRSSALQLEIRMHNMPLIEQGMFSNSELEKLVVTNANLSLLKKNSFVNMNKLKYLSLMYNKLDFFDSTFLFRTSSPIETLNLAKNKLYAIYKNTFSLLTNLVTLSVASNNIDTIEEGSFTKLTRLTWLHLHDNRIKVIEPNVFAPVQEHLVMFYLQVNKLTYLSQRVLARLPQLIEIRLYANPWQCPCWYELREYLEERKLSVWGFKPDLTKPFTQGAYPVCVTHELPSQGCHESQNYTEDFSRFYFTKLAEYVPLDDLLDVYF